MVRRVRTQPKATDASCLRGLRSVTVTRAATVPTPASSRRKLTRGGAPAVAVRGTLSLLTTGRGWTRPGTPYWVPPAWADDGACVPPGSTASAGAGSPPQRSAAVTSAGRAPRGRCLICPASAQRDAGARPARRTTRLSECGVAARALDPPRALALVEFLQERLVCHAQALADRHLGAPAQLPLRQSDIEAAVLELARAQVGELGLDPLAGRIAELPPDGAHIRLDARGDVVGAGLAGGGQERAHHVIDVDVVPRRLAVPVEFRRPSAVEVFGEDRHHPRLAVGVLARTVDIPQATHRVGYACLL